jgi:hypothetical protein
VREGEIVSDHPLTALLGSRRFAGVFRVHKGKSEAGWIRWKADPETLIERHIRGELVLGAVHGAETTTMVMATETDGGSHETLRNSLGRPVDARAATLEVRAELGRLGFHPPIVASSKSGDGYHLRILFSEPVPSERARLVMRAIKVRVGLDEIDVVYPASSGGEGLVLALPFAGMAGSCPFVRAGGSRLVHPASLEPYPDEQQLETLAEWPLSTPAMLERAAEILKIDVEETREAPALRIVPPVKSTTDRVPEYFNELDVLAEKCAFVEHAASDPASLSYTEWFSLATVLAPFPGGKSLFDAISRRDSKRYARGEPDKKIESVGGKPRLCTNLGWSCPNLSECSALGVRSPAGLPFKLKLRKAQKHG